MSEQCKFKTCEYGFCALYPTDYVTNDEEAIQIVSDDVLGLLDEVTKQIHKIRFD